MLFKLCLLPIYQKEYIAEVTPECGEYTKNWNNNRVNQKMKSPNDKCLPSGELIISLLL
jgi:Cft2 family RNA processing exonuclease